MKISLGLTTTYEAFLVINVIRRLRVPDRQNSPVNGMRTVSRHGRTTALKKARKRRARARLKCPGHRGLTTSVSLKYSGRFPPPVATADRYIKPNHGIGGCREFDETRASVPRHAHTCVRIVVTATGGDFILQETTPSVSPVDVVDSSTSYRGRHPRLKFDEPISPRRTSRLPFSHGNVCLRRPVYHVPAPVRPV